MLLFQEATITTNLGEIAVTIIQSPKQSLCLCLRPKISSLGTLFQHQATNGSLCFVPQNQSPEANAMQTFIQNRIVFIVHCVIHNDSRHGFVPMGTSSVQNKFAQLRFLIGRCHNCGANYFRHPCQSPNANRKRNDHTTKETNESNV